MALARVVTYSMMLNLTVCFILYTTTLTFIVGYQYPRGILRCKLHKISKLDCSNRKLTDIPPLPPNITDLDLSYNQLVRFTPLKTNGKISMNMNKPKSVFSGQKKMTYLNLSRNKLNNLNDAFFADLSSLQKLFINYSEVQIISHSTFKGLHNLQILHFCFNPFHSLPSGIFSDLTKLQSLYIKSHHLTRVPSEVIVPLHALVDLSLNIMDFTSQKLEEGFEKVDKSFIFSSVC